MDLSEKKKKLEAIRAAREAKQRIVDQYSSAAKAATTSVSPSGPRVASPNAPQPPRHLSASVPAPFSNAHALPSNVGPLAPKSAVPAATPSSARATSAGSDNSRRPSATSVQDTTESGAAARSASPKKGRIQVVHISSPHPTHPPMPQPREPASFPIHTPSQPTRQQERRHSTASDGSTPSSLRHRPQQWSLPPPSPRYRQGLDSLRNWSQLLDRSVDAAVPSGGTHLSVGLTARCAFAPKVCLGREGRVPVDIAVSYLPYRKEQQLKDGSAITPGGVDTAACVAAAYSAGATNRETSARSDGADYTETGFPWGSAHAALPRPGTHRGATVVSLDTASKRGRRSPGLALAWTILPGSATRDGFSSQMTQCTADVAVDEETAAIAAAAPDATIDLVVLTPLLCDVELSSFIAHPFRPGVFIGGTRTGRIVMWQVAAEWINLDRKQLRARATATTGSPATLVWRPQRPCASTFPSPLSHQAPLLKLAVHGDTSSHYLYAISQDAKVATWPAWQPTEPLSFRSGYLGSKSIGYTASAAAFANQRGSDAMTKVYIGTVGGTMLEGFNRDSRVVELTYCGGPDPTAAAPSAPDATSARSLSAHGIGGDSSESSKRNLGVSSSSLGLSNPAGGGIGLGGGPFLSPHHCGRVTAVAVQAQGDVLRDDNCVVSAAVDGSCIAWLGDTAYRLENFSAPVTALEWSPTYTALFAAGDEEGLVTLWNVFQSTATPVFSLSTQQLSMLQPSSSTAAAILAVGNNGDSDGGLDGDSLLSMAAASNMTVVDPVEGAAVAVTSLKFSNDGRWLFVGIASGNVFATELGKGLY